MVQSAYYFLCRPGRERMAQPATNNKWVAMSGIGMGVFMATLDSSIGNISLPTLVDVFHTSLATIEWVVLGYVLVLTMRANGFHFAYYFPLGGLLMTLAFGLLLGVAAALLPARSAARMDVVDALRYE